MSPIAHRWYEFGEYRLDALAGLLMKGAQAIVLRPKTMETLRVLVESHGELVSKDVLLNEIWPGSFVEEAGLARNVSELRRALGKHNKQPYIETISKRGYRIAVTVNAIEAATSKETPTLLVIPFHSRGNSDDPYAMGFNDTLLERLGFIRELKIATVDGYAGIGAPLAIAHSLQAEYVLTGTIAQHREDIQVYLRLLNVRSGTTIWSETFREPVGDPLQAKESICEEIAGAMALKFGLQEGKLLSRRYVQNSEAYQAYLRGRFHWNRRSEGGFRAAIEHFEKAIDMDPEYAPAFSGLADCYAMLPMVSALPPRRYMPKAKSAALNALDIDESLVEARSSLAFVKWHYDWNWAAAERDFKRILKFHPSRAVTHLSYSLLLAELGRFSEALEHAHRAHRLEPEAASIGANFAMVLHLATRDVEAITAAKKVLAEDGTSARARWALGLSLQHTGRIEEAVIEFRRMIRDFGEMPSAMGSLGFLLGTTGKTKEAYTLLDRLLHGRNGCPYDRALIHLGLGQAEQALQSLEDGCEQRAFHLVMLKVDRRMGGLHSHPRFAALLRRIHID
jgi:DNA-binding winged helix-turn-helix (wHTH) protein/tetratricopeptide (TPR) repeat protein